MNYSNTNEKLYDDIALWEKTDGRDLFAQMPLTPAPRKASIGKNVTLSTTSKKAQ